MGRMPPSDNSIAISLPDAFSASRRAAMPGSVSVTQNDVTWLSACTAAAADAGTPSTFTSVPAASFPTAA